MGRTILEEFRVGRGAPSLVVPVLPTPRERKPLSDIDNQEALRFYIVAIHMYQGDGSKNRLIDPASVVRAALAEALVHYYPLAGRLREEAGGKMVVDCGGQGVVFVEAAADISLRELEDVQYPPSKLLVYDDDDQESPPAVVVDQPLLYVQVTRLKCGGFTIGTRMCHCIGDAPGLAQFWTDVGDMARGAHAPFVRPVWAREIFSAARLPPPPPHPEPEGHELLIRATPPGGMVRVSIFFGPEAIAALRGRVKHGAAASQFDLVAACVWRSRTAALGYRPGDEARLVMAVNGRGRSAGAFGRPEIPAGFYGNAFAHTVACSAAGDLCGRDLGYAVGLIRKAQERVTYDDYMRSAVTQGRRRFPLSWKSTLNVSDLSQARLFDEAEFGWGKPVSGCAITEPLQNLPGGSTLSMHCKNDLGQQDMTFVVGIDLPEDCTARYKMEVEALTTTSSTNMEIAFRARF